MADSEPTGTRATSRQLPPGWKMVQSEKGVYYWHKETKRTQWHFPEEEGRNHIVRRVSEGARRVSEGVWWGI